MLVFLVLRPLVMLRLCLGTHYRYRIEGVYLGLERRYRKYWILPDFRAS